MGEVIVDQLNRPIHDLRISVTDRCNFRCKYCMPKEVFGNDHVFLPKEELLSFEEIERLSRIYAKLGVKKLRLTGGEPLLRKDLDQLIARLNEIPGIEDIGLTTNAKLLKLQGEKLYSAGLRRLNISLDAIDDETFKSINDRNVSSQEILDNIHYAISLGFKVKVNMVVQKGVNDHEVIPMAKYFKSHGITLRFIEFMDVGNDNAWDMKKVKPSKEIANELDEIFGLEPLSADYYGEVANRYRYKDSQAEVGFISSVTNAFCNSCTRARISSNGYFYGCLFATKGIHLKPLLRDESLDDEAVYKSLVDIWQGRNDQYSNLRDQMKGQREHQKINMNYIGG